MGGESNVHQKGEFMVKYAEKVAYVSHERCSISGVYWSSGCEHADAKNFDMGEILPCCGLCGREVRWLMYRSSALPVNASAGQNFYNALLKSFLPET
jgi:hypothetical protein